jgi:outer membrane lipoprotein SlyB
MVHIPYGASFNNRGSMPGVIFACGRQADQTIEVIAMNKVQGAVLFLLAMVAGPALAGTAQEIQYGVIQETRLFTESVSAAPNSTSNNRHGLRTLGAAAIGGAVGNQFGGGTGQDVATATGAVAGAAASRRRQAAETSAAAAPATGQPMVELTVKTDAGKLLSVVQQSKAEVTFSKGEKVKILTSGADTHVEKAQ